MRRVLSKSDKISVFLQRGFHNNNPGCFRAMLPVSKAGKHDQHDLYEKLAMPGRHYDYVLFLQSFYVRKQSHCTVPVQIFYGDLFISVYLHQTGGIV